MNAQDIVSDLLEGFKEKKAAFIAAGADPAAVDAAIAEFKKLKARQMLQPGEVDIDKYQTLADLEALVKEAGQRTRGAAAKKRTFPIRDDAILVHDDDNVTIVVPQTYEASKFYGKGTKWCVASEDYPGHWSSYRKDLAKHYYFLFKNRSSSDVYYKMALTRWPGNRFDGRDAKDDAVSEADWKRLTGFDPKDFKPWDWRQMPPHEQWKVAKKEQGMTFTKFVSTVDDTTWDAIGTKVNALKQQWVTAQKAEKPDATDEQLNQDWVEFWRAARKDAMNEPSDRDYLDVLQYYMDLTESRNRLSVELANLILEGIIEPGQAKAWIMSIADMGKVRARLREPSRFSTQKEMPQQEPEPYQAFGDEPDVEHQHHQPHGQLP